MARIEGREAIEGWLGISLPHSVSEVTGRSIGDGYGNRREIDVSHIDTDDAKPGEGVVALSPPEAGYVLVSTFVEQVTSATETALIPETVHTPEKDLGRLSLVPRPELEPVAA